MGADAVAAANRIVQGESDEEAKLVAAAFLHAVANLAKLEAILESVGLSHSQAVQIIRRMQADEGG